MLVGHEKGEELTDSPPPPPFPPWIRPLFNYFLLQSFLTLHQEQVLRTLCHIKGAKILKKGETSRSFEET